MINNRQNGRRRGRGGGPRTPNTPSPGNRQDNRQRGNASQLLEKYKSMARDAQMQGDRVLSESYLQFAEHYFRVLNESRARFEEQRRQRGDYSDEDEDQDEAAHAQQGGDEQPEREERFDRGNINRNRNDRGDGGHHRPQARAPERDEEEAGDEQEERISLEVLPPAIAATGDGDEAARGRPRRPRRPRPDGDTEIAPAA